MKSLRELYRIGNGPSSSHTMAPRRAASRFVLKHANAKIIRATLFDSLAATGKGHLTDAALRAAVEPNALEIVWRPDETLGDRENGMRFEALDESGRVIGSYEVHSVGGGSLSDDAASEDVYGLGTMRECLEHCRETGTAFWEYVGAREGDTIWGFFGGVRETMRSSIEAGTQTEGVLPGGLGVPRKARSLYRKSMALSPAFRKDGMLAAFAVAVAEENAAGGRIVTAPTCGSSGVLPSVLHYCHRELECSETDIHRAIATAGLVGNIVKQNGSISGAVVGCQGEIGVACAMAAAAATQLMGGTPSQIEYAAEMGLEHHLGLTCDPVQGLVQIPCIERNAHAAARAMYCASFALLSDGLHRISFDDVVAVMLETGKALPKQYRETSAGGLAAVYRKRIAERCGGAGSSE